MIPWSQHVSLAGHRIPRLLVYLNTSKHFNFSYSAIDYIVLWIIRLSLQWVIVLSYHILYFGTILCIQLLSVVPIWVGIVPLWSNFFYCQLLHQTLKRLDRHHGAQIMRQLLEKKHMKIQGQRMSPPKGLLFWTIEQLWALPWFLLEWIYLMLQQIQEVQSMQFHTLLGSPKYCSNNCLKCTISWIDYLELDWCTRSNRNIISWC